MFTKIIDDNNKESDNTSIDSEEYQENNA